jgi:AMIN domain-containing protein
MSRSIFRFSSRAAFSLLWGASLSGFVLGSGAAQAEDARTGTEPEPRVEDTAKASAEIIFTGFSRHADQGASIFVRMTGEVPVQTERAGKRLTYRLNGARLKLQNNQNPLPTEYFGPPVSNVALVPSSTGVDLVIDLSGSPGEAGPTHRYALQGGIATLHVELPPAELSKAAP